LQPEQLDLLRHQLKEIRDANLQPGEDEEVLRKYKLSENSKRLLQLANQAAALLSQGENSLVEQVRSVFRSVSHSARSGGMC
jgi:DNA repair ATPase RecN